MEVISIIISMFTASSFSLSDMEMCRFRSDDWGIYQTSLYFSLDLIISPVNLFPCCGALS